MLTLDIAGAQIDGARDYQEDAFLITRLAGTNDRDTKSLCIVADGMGGHAAGNVASNMAVQTFNKHVTAHYPANDLPAVLREAVLQANHSISETVRETAALKGMGCTLVAAVFEGASMRWVSVGDSHLYLVRNGELSKRNADHSYGGFLDRMAAEGTPVEPEGGFSRNMLMSALTGDDIADIDCPAQGIELKAGDRIVIASDGLDSLSNGKIVEYCQAASSAKECVDALLAGVAAADMPRQDNTTVIAVLVAAAAAAETTVVTKAGTEARPAAAAGKPGKPVPAFVVEHVPEPVETRGKAGLIIAAVLAHLAIIGGVVWWLLQPSSQAPEVVEGKQAAVFEPDTPPIEEPAEEPSEEPSVASTKPDAEPAPAESDPESTRIGEIAPGMPAEAFRDPLRGGGQGPLMIAIPGGRYRMGSPDSSPLAEQRPQHTVAIEPFAMSVYEVSVADYERFARAAGRRVPPVPAATDRAAFPATWVSWNDALEYVQWLSNQTGKSYRLPSEAEWEYAARAGSEGNYWWGHELGSGNAHCIACDTGLDPRNPTRSGRFGANRFGLYDTAGNVAEWVHDCWHPNYNNAPTNGGVFEGGDCGSRVVRGGSFGGAANSLRSAHRDKLRADQGNDSTGLRVVRDP
jgi:formylglycine-generating enzyme required for sulfatase activity/serine/threonine protein phosphatase PrpC